VATKIFEEHAICPGSDTLPEEKRWDDVQGWCDVCGRWMQLTGVYKGDVERRLPQHGTGHILA
jgi:hypothetical protein